MSVSLFRECEPLRGLSLEVFPVSHKSDLHPGSWTNKDLPQDISHVETTISLTFTPKERSSTYMTPCVNSGKQES